MSPTDQVDRNVTTPFLLKLFYRTGAFHRPDEFSNPYSLPPDVTFHAWPSATLSELTHQLAATAPHLLPKPAIGTRLVFRLLYYDTRTVGEDVAARFVMKDLGSVVIGDGGPGISTDPDECGETEAGRLRMGPLVGSETEGAKTLMDARFVVGDYISCAILPPASDGSVQPASAARAGRGFGAGQARSMVDAGPPPTRTRDGWSVTPYVANRGANNARAPPVGEWRRGEKLPDGPPGRGSGRRRW